MGTAGCLPETTLAAYLDRDLPEAERRLVEAHLDECGACRELVSELVRCAPEDSGASPARSAPGQFETSLASEPTEPSGTYEPRLPLAVGTVVGRYRILGIIGSGGMAVVYSAHDPRLGRQIALKLLRPGTDRRLEVQVRLLREAQVMARLSHPNVVAVFDAGTYDNQVFVAMELVEGVTLASWLRKRPRSWREVLRVFLAAGRGLAAAHQAGLVHRDFKPANVLIGETQIKVGDFGLARPSEDIDDFADAAATSHPPASAVTLPAGITRPGTVLGTPAYMSPEQRRGESADASSDQYSFCLALYEGLYDERPFPRGRGDLDPVEVRAVHEPSRGAQVPTFVRRALLQGLAPRREDRHASMDTLLEALSRDPAVRRRRWVLAISGLATVASVLLGTYLLVERRGSLCQGAAKEIAGVWNGARKRAIRSAFLRTAKPYAADAWKGAAATLDTYARRWVSMHTDACEATHVRGEQSAALLDMRMWCLQQRLEVFAALTSIFAKADAAVVGRAVRAAGALPSLSRCADVQALRSRGPPPPDPKRRAQVKALRASLSRVQAIRHAGKYAAALRAAMPLPGLARALAYRPLEAQTLVLLGELRDLDGEPQEALPPLREAISVAHAGRDDVSGVKAAALLAEISSRLAQQDEARRWGRYAAAGIERLGGDPALQALLQRAVARVHLQGGHYGEARAGFERALTILRKTLPAKHLDLADAHAGLGRALTRLGNYEKALHHLRRSLAIRKRVLGPRHPSVARALGSIALVLAQQGKNREGLGSFREALTILEAALGPWHLEVAAAHQQLGSALLSMGRYTESLSHHRRSLAIREKVLGPKHPQVAASLSQLGATLRYLGRYQEALAYQKRALAIRRETLRSGHPLIGDSLNQVGVSLRLLGKNKEAAQYYRRALALRQESLGPEHPLTIQSLSNLGVALQFLGRYDEALALLHKALLIRERIYGRDNSLVAFTLRHLGNVHLAQGQLGAALGYFRRALSIRERVLGRSHPEVARSLTDVGKILVAQGKPRAALAVLERALALRKTRRTTSAHLARVRFLLARALWDSHRDRTRALRLARQARRDYARAGPRYRHRRQRLTAWLSAR